MRGPFTTATRIQPVNRRYRDAHDHSKRLPVQQGSTRHQTCESAWVKSGDRRPNTLMWP